MMQFGQVLHDFTVRLRHTRAAYCVAVGSPREFTAVVSARDADHALEEAARLVASLNGLVEVVEITEGSGRWPVTESGLRRRRNEAAGTYLSARLDAKLRRCESSSREWALVGELGELAVKANDAFERHLA